MLCAATSSEDRIVYDDKAVAQLLDRSQVGQEEKAMAMNEYLDSFKVATYQTKEGEEEVRNSTLAFFKKSILMEIFSARISFIFFSASNSLLIIHLTE